MQAVCIIFDHMEQVLFNSLRNTDAPAVFPVKMT